MNNSIKVSDVFQPSWKYTKSQIWILAGLYIGYIIIYFTLSIFMLPAGNTIIGNLLSFLVSMIITTMFYLGYIKNMFQTMEEEEPQFSAYLQSPKKVINAVLASLAYGVAVSFATILFIIPGIYVGLRLQFYLMFIVEENAGCIESLKKSWAITRGKFGILFLLAVTEILIILIGACLLGIGIFVALPLVAMMGCYTYRLLNDPLRSGERE
ncbi:MAG TPA: hypothetical protein DDZ04_07605 [Parabacteroides sp.]|nr:hypothetical protein [Parabacteroides sp.]